MWFVPLDVATNLFIALIYLSLCLNRAQDLEAKRVPLQQTECQRSRWPLPTQNREFHTASGVLQSDVHDIISVLNKLAIQGPTAICTVTIQCYTYKHVQILEENELFVTRIGSPLADFLEVLRHSKFSFMILKYISFNARSPSTYRSLRFQILALIPHYEISTCFFKNCSKLEVTAKPYTAFFKLLVKLLLQPENDH